MPERSVPTCGSDRYSDPLRAACPGAPGSCPALEMGDAGQRTGTSHYTHQWGPTDKRENRNKWEHGKFQLSVKKNLPPRVLQHWTWRPERMRDLYSNLSYTASRSWPCFELGMGFQRSFPTCTSLWEAHFQCLQNTTVSTRLEDSWEPFLFLQWSPLGFFQELD